MSRWWRAYDEALHDPKVIALSDRLHRAWFNLLCVASKNGGVLPATNVVAIELRVSAVKAAEYITALVVAGLLDEVETGRFAPHNWKSRQFQSDVSTERVKRFRERERNVSSAVSETPPETETYTEAETEKNSSLRSEARKRATRLADDWMPSEEDGRYSLEKGLTQAEAQHEFEKFRNYWQSKSGQSATKTDWSKTWRNWILTTVERKGKPNGNGRARGNQSLSELAFDLADEARQRELAGHAGRADDALGGH